MAELDELDAKLDSIRLQMGIGNGSKAKIPISWNNLIIIMVGAIMAFWGGYATLTANFENSKRDIAVLSERVTTIETQNMSTRDDVTILQGSVSMLVNGIEKLTVKVDTLVNKLDTERSRP